MACCLGHVLVLSLYVTRPLLSCHYCLVNVRKNEVDIEDLKNKCITAYSSSGKVHEAAWVHRHQNEPRNNISSNIFYCIPFVFPLSM